MAIFNGSVQVTVGSIYYLVGVSPSGATPSDFSPDLVIFRLI